MISNRSNESRFSFSMPAMLEKGKDGNWKVRGLASTEKLDLQGETILQRGIQVNPIDSGRGILNWEHGKGPENTIGLLDGYARNERGFYVEGRLFKNHSKAKAVREIMESLGEGDRGRVGLSVEGRILERDPANPKVIKKCEINAVALTMNPVNPETYVDLVKSFNGADELEFNAQETGSIDQTSEEPTFTASQVLTMIQKALGLTQGNAQAPDQRTGGDALGQESLDPKPKKKLKKMPKEVYKSNLLNILDKLQILYPEASRSELWEAVKERLDTCFPLESVEN